MKPTQVIAHRGSSAHHADNSWAAFEAAVAEGADAIECDVQATRDGVLVIRHDLVIDGHPIASLSVAGLAACTDVVTLRDLVAWAVPTGIELLVELKDPAAAAAVAEMIATGPMHARSVIASFSAPALVAARAARNDIRTSFMMGSVVDAGELVQLAKACGAGGVHLCWESRAPYPHRLLTRDAVAALRRAGLAITLWHEERVDELHALVALEPDAICSNTPAALRRIVDAHRRSAGTSRSDAGNPTTIGDGSDITQSAHQANAHQRSIDSARKRHDQGETS